jgi:hypothetical protein
MKKLIILSGKARSGKDTVFNYIKDYYKSENVIAVSFAYYLKDYLKRMDLFDEGEKPRSLMQQFGASLKEKFGYDFLIKRTLEDIEVFREKYDVIVVTDARLKKEVFALKEKYPDSIFIRIVRNSCNDLTDEQKMDITETDLDDYEAFDYVLENDENIEEKVKRCLDE